jgi:hypothetical protein
MIAEVQGDAFGFGFDLAILCDFTLVSSSAKLAFPEMRKGLPPAAIMAYLGRYALPKQVFWPDHERLRLPYTAHAPLTDHPRNKRTGLIASRGSVLTRSPGLRGIIKGAHTMQSNPLTTSCREDRSQTVRLRRPPAPVALSHAVACTDD